MGKHYRHSRPRGALSRLPSLHKAGRSIQPDRCSSGSLAIEHLSRVEAQSRRQVGYKPSYAHEQAAPAAGQARAWSSMPSCANSSLTASSSAGRPSRSPAGCARRRPRRRISHESIYRFIYAQIRRTNDGSWRHYLPRAKGKRGRRRRASRSPVSLINAVFPSLCGPPRSRCAPPSAIGRPISCCSPPPATPSSCRTNASPDAVCLAKQPGKASLMPPPACSPGSPRSIRLLRKSITFDNGTEFAQHLLLVDQLDVQTFFCDPHSPWQKGTIENAIGRLRRFLPRSTNIDTIDDEPSTPHRRLQQHAAKMPRVQDPSRSTFAQLLHFKCESTPSLRSG